MQAYIIFTAPAIMMITAYFWYFLKQNKSNFKYVLPVKILMVLLLALPVRYSIERIKPFTFRDNPANIRDLKIFAATQSFPSEKTVIFGTPIPIETMFYTGCTAYDISPDSTTLKELSAKGYSIYFYKDGKYIRPE